MAEMSLAEALYFFEQQEQGCQWTLEQFEQSLANPLTSLDVHYQQGQMVGYVLSSNLGDMFEVLQITVASAYQRQGVATQLLDLTLDKAKSLGCERVVLEVRETNHRAIALYQKLGFQFDGVRKNYYRNTKGDSENALLMSLTC